MEPPVASTPTYAACCIAPSTAAHQAAPAASSVVAFAAAVSVHGPVVMRA